MAPPIPGTRNRPAASRRRSPGDLLVGLLAVATLLVLTAGVPFALVTVFGLPIPHTMPTLSVLTHPLDVFAILRVLSVLVWLAWIQLVCCVIAEVRAAVRNAGMPARVPLAGGTQEVVHRLVTAALLAFAATTALSPAFAHQAPASAPPAATATGAPGAGSRAGSGAGPGAQHGTGHARPPEPAGHPHAAHSPGVERIYVVQPPVGRFHESLWEIAEKFLGDGRRYREIFEMNSGRIQPDGSRLTIASLIRPGWVLHMPRDAHGPGIEVVTAGSGPSGGHAAPVGGAATAGGPTGHTGHGHTGQQPPGGAAAGAAGVDRGGEFGYPNELAAAALLATGVLAALGRRRREQLWQRAFGRRVVGPEGEAAVAESALRAGADEPSVRLLDTGLRYLSHALAQAGRTPPTVFAAHLSSENLDLWIAPADLDAPSPWTAVGDGQVWRLPFTAMQRVDVNEASDALALFPGLVSIGADRTGRVLVDLEAAHGLISVTGPPAMVTAALSAMAVELATNRWSDQMHITLVGFGDDLTQLAPDRITSVATLDEALLALEARAVEVAEAMADSGVGSALSGRSLGADPAAWAPHYLITAVPPTPRQSSRLLCLAQVRHATAAGYVVAGDAPGAAWAWEVTEDGRLLAGALGFDVQAQLLPVRQHEAVARLFEAAAQAEGVPLAAPPADAAPSQQLDPGSAMPVEISILGPASVHAPGVIEPDRVGLVTELLVYLAAHPGGVHPNVLSSVIWRRGADAQVRAAALDRAREWLGTDSIGRPHLATDAGGRLRLGSGVRVDWQVFCALAGHAELSPPGSAEEAGYLARALALVGGQLLDGHDPRRYAWLATDGLEYEVTARVADTAHRLAELRLADGDAEGAMDAARAGLRLAFNDELLWRDLLRGAHATGLQDLTRAVVDEMCAKTALDEVLPRMAPETEALIDEICPSWRSSV